MDEQPAPPPATPETALPSQGSEPVWVRGQSGAIVQVDPADIQALSGDIAGLATQPEIQQHLEQQYNQRHQTSRNQAASFADGMLRSAYDSTVGLIPGAGTGSEALANADALIGGWNKTTKERQELANQSLRRQRRLAQTNAEAGGWGRFTGQVAGAVGLSAATGGFGGLGTLGTVGRLGVAGIEGGVMGLSSAREEAFIRDEQLSASAAWDAIGHGAAMGAVLGGGFKLGGAGIRAAGGSLRRGLGYGAEAAVSAAEGVMAGAAAKAGSEGAQTLEGALESKAAGGKGMYERVVEGVRGYAKRVGVSDEAAETMLGSEGRQARKLLTEGVKGGDELGREIHSAVNDMQRAGSWLDELQLNRPQIMKGLHNPNLSQIQRSASTNVLTDQATALESAQSALGKTGNADTRALMKEVGGKIEELQSKITDADGPGLFHLQNQLKQTQQKTVMQLRSQATYLGSKGQSSSAGALREAADNLESGQARLRDHLMDEQVWGDAGKAQRGFNEGYEEFLADKKKFTQAFTREGERQYATGRNEVLADSAKTSSYARSLGTAAADDTTASMEQTLLGAKRLIAEAENHEGLQTPAFSEFKNAIAKLDQVHTEAVKHAEVQRMMGQITEAAEKSTAGKILGHIPVVGKALEAIANPATMVRTLGLIERHTSSADSVISQVAGNAVGAGKAAAKTTSAASNVIGTAIRRTRAAATKSALGNLTGVDEGMKDTARRAATSAGVQAAFFKGAKSPAEAYDRRAREIQAAAQPGAIEQHAAQILGPAGQGAPKFAAAFTAQARTATDFLSSKLPVPPGRPGELQGDRKLPMIDKQAIEKFGRYYTAVNSPMDTVRLLERGQLRPEHVEALQAVHPQILQKLQQSVMKQVQTMPGAIPPARVRQLDLLLHLNGSADPSIKPENLQIMKQVGKQQAQQAQQQQPKQSTPPKLAGMSAPRSEQLAKK